MPNGHRDRFEIPQHVIDDIDAIGAKSFADVAFTDTLTEEIADIEYNFKADSRERKKIVELLKMIVEPSTGNDYSDRMRAEVAVKLLDQMGYPVEAFDHILGMGYAPEMIADKMMEEGMEESDDLRNRQKTRIIGLLKTILDTPVVDDGFEHGKAIMMLEGMGYPKDSYYVDLHLGTPVEYIAERLVRGQQDNDLGIDIIT